MNTATITDARQVRGLALAKGKAKKIKPVAGSTWLVPSASGGGGGYVVDVDKGTCSCPDAEERGVRCKHQFAVAYVRAEIAMPDGAVLVAETRVTYAQPCWSAYHKAQVMEKDTVELLLRGLCDGIVEPQAKKTGRPPMPLAALVFAATLKVFSTMSGRRASSDIRAAKERGRLGTVAHYNTISEHLARPDLAPLLKVLVTESALPLKAIESQFAVDATGFATNTYARWYDEKYGEEKRAARWIKAHAMVGTKTHVITAVEVTESNVHDSPMLAPVLATTAANFNMREVSADKAYLANDNLTAIEAVGAVPYIPFKINSQGNGSEAWRRLWHLYSLNREDFLGHYHRRSNVESVFSSVKRKFGAAVRAKLPTAQVNEVLLKCIAHNLSMLVHSIHELGVDPKFWRGGGQ
jgi:transposase